MSSFFYPYLPHGRGDWMDSLRSARIESIITVFFITALIVFCMNLVHFWFENKVKASPWEVI